MRELTEDAIIRAGGWHPRYARVLLIECAGGFGLVLIDGNGDGAELEIEYWLREADGGWRGGSTSGHGSLDRLPRSQSWSAGDFVAALGRAEPGAEVTVEYAGRSYRRRASQLGIWGFVHAAGAAGSGGLPRLAAADPPSR